MAADVHESGMEVDGGSQRSQLRANVWGVDVQAQTTRPASCRSCGLPFQAGELRLCTWGARTCARWTCSTCLQGRLPEGAEFRATGRGNAESVEAARVQTARMTAPAERLASAGEAPAAEPERQADSVQHPAWEERKLPDKEWWTGFSWEDALRSGSTTHVQIPDRFRGAVLQARRKTLEVLREARGQGEAKEEWKLFLLLDLLLLSSSREAATCAEMLEERLAWFWGGQWAALWASVRNGKKMPTATAKTSDKQRAARVHTLAAAGEEGRALRATTSAKLAPRTAETLQKVKACFPTAARPAQRPAQRPDPPPELFQQVRDEAVRLLRRPPKLTAPGLLGCRLEHLAAATGCEETLSWLGEAAAWVAFGMVPEDAMSALRTGEITAHRKGIDGVRPIVVGPTLRRLGLRALVRAKKDQLRDAAGTRQYGVGRRGGAELLLRKLEAQAETRPTAVFLKVDLESAFPRLEREPANEAMARHEPEVAAVLQAWYGGEDKHLWRDAAGNFHELPSTRGYDQGDPLSPAGFSVAQREALDGFFEELLRLDPLAKCYSYLDDTYLVVEATLASIALQALQAVLEPLGLRLNTAKTAAWSPAGRAVLTEDLQRCWTPSLPVLGKHLRAPGDAESSAPANLGEPAGSLDAATQRLRDLSAELLKLHKAGLGKQAVGALLRAYAGPASQHSLRMELATDEATQRYDDQLLASWRELLQRDLGDEARTLLGLPAREGGVGAQLASTRRYAAYLASWGAAAEEVTEDLGSGTLADCLVRLPRATTLLEKARQGLRAQGLELAGGGDLATALRTPLRQGLATEKVQKTTRAALLQRLPLSRQAELRGAAGRGSAGFLAYPEDALCTLEDAHWETATRQRLQLPRAELSQQELAAAGAACCLHGADGTSCARALDERGYHALTCQLGGGVVLRHGRLARRTGGLLTRWRGERPLFEQRVPTWDRTRANGELERAILDLEYQDDDGRRWLDVSIRHPAAGTQAELRVAARRDGEASRRGERDKHARYPGARLTPFVLEAGGRMGAEARFWLLSQVRQMPEDQQQRELARAYKVLSCGLQADTAKQLRSAAGLR